MTVGLIVLQQGQTKETTSEVEVVMEYMNGSPEMDSKNASRWAEGSAGSRVVGSIKEAIKVKGIDLFCVRVK